MIRYFVKTLIIFFVLSKGYSQINKTTLFLDLKKVYSNYELSKQKYKSNKDLFDNRAISEIELINSKNELLNNEIEIKKIILNLISEESQIVIEKAVKFQTNDNINKVKLTIRYPKNEDSDYLNHFENLIDSLSKEFNNRGLFNVNISLLKLDDKTIISYPYELVLPSLKRGESTTIEFGLLQDVESVQIQLKYEGKIDTKNILLGKDDNVKNINITSNLFSQECELGVSATYEITLEGYSSSSQTYQLAAINLPPQVEYEFIDIESNARVSQINFNHGIKQRKLFFKLFLPDRTDSIIRIDKSILFNLVISPNNEFSNYFKGKYFTKLEMEKQNIKNIELEIIPRGVAALEIIAPTLYQEIKIGESKSLKATIRNSGTRELNNIRITTEAPIFWNSNIIPNIISSLKPEEEIEINLSIFPPQNTNPGTQEFKLKAQALSNNIRVQANDRTIRINIITSNSYFITILLIIIILLALIGIVVFGIKISKK